MPRQRVVSHFYRARRSTRWLSAGRNPERIARGRYRVEIHAVRDMPSRQNVPGWRVGQLYAEPTGEWLVVLVRVPAKSTKSPALLNAAGHWADRGHFERVHFRQKCASLEQAQCFVSVTLAARHALRTLGPWVRARGGIYTAPAYCYGPSDNVTAPCQT